MSLTQGQLAARLGLTDRHVRRLRDTEGLPAIGEGRAAVYDLGAVCAWFVRSGRSAPGLEACMVELAGAGAAGQPGVAPGPASPGADQARLAGIPATPTPDSTATPPTAAPHPPTPSAPGDAPPAGAAEQGLAVTGRRRSWRAAELALRSVEGQLVQGKLKVTPQHAESLARTARMLTSSVKGDGAIAVDLSPREVLVRALARWIRQWGAPGLEDLLGAARARADAPEDDA